MDARFLATRLAAGLLRASCEVYTRYKSAYIMLTATVDTRYLGNAGKSHGQGWVCEWWIAAVDFHTEIPAYHNGMKSDQA